MSVAIGPTVDELSRNMGPALGALRMWQNQGLPMFGLAADLLEMHIRKSLSLDDWIVAKDFVERMVNNATSDTNWQVQKNGA